MTKAECPPEKTTVQTPNHLMLYAINYSPQAAELLRKGRIEIDRFKCPPWPDMIAEAEKLRPVAVHFPLRAGSGDLERNTDWKSIERFLKNTATAYVNLHLAVRAKEMPHLPADQRLEGGERQQVIERLLKDVEAVTRRFGTERVIAENVPWHQDYTPNLFATVQPEVIRAVIETAGCGLLLDISHARISAHYAALDAAVYMNALPLKRLRELHFTGIHDWGYILMDHLSVLEEDWPWLDWVLDGIRRDAWGKAHMLAFEYGGIGGFFQDHTDQESILHDVPPMYARVKDIT